MRAIAIAVLLLVTASACGGAASRDAATPPPPVTMTATLGNEIFVAVRLLPPAALSAEQLEAAGMAMLSSGGGEISMARADTPDAAPWELVSATADGWRVWRPKVVLDTLAAAGANASLMTVEQVDWPDACLGAAEPDQLCAQVITPGYRIIVERAGGRIEYHTSRVGGARPAPAPSPAS